MDNLTFKPILNKEDLALCFVCFKITIFAISINTEFVITMSFFDENQLIEFCHEKELYKRSSIKQH